MGANLPTPSIAGVRLNMVLAALFVIALIGRAGCVQGATYHVDSQEGDDANNGLSTKNAWQTLERVNAREFAPGDRIVFRAGCEWRGALEPKGSGQRWKPIVVDQYGEGAKPAIHGEGRVAATVRLVNQSYWEIQNLEITNQSKSGERELRGVEIRARDAGLVRHIHLKKLDVHDVNGISTYRDDSDAVAKSYGGLTTLVEGSQTPTAWDDLLIEDCTFRDVGPAGISMLTSWTAGHRENDARQWFPSRGVIIRGNTIERSARNGLIVRGCKAPLIERNLFKGCAHAGSGNACFAFHCDDALFQFNEACFTVYNDGDTDAAGFDSDYYCRRSVFHGNYSHDNGYGFMLVCNRGPAGFNEGTIVRYNISQNDQGNVFRFSGAISNTRVYNNTIFAGPTMKNPREDDPPRIIYHKSWNGGWSDELTFANNIVVNHSRAAVYETGKSTKNRFLHNLFFGEHPESEPEDATKIVADPLLLDAGSARMGFESAIAAYGLRRGSPAIFAGRPLGQLAERDFAGRRVARMRGRVDLGALGWNPRGEVSEVEDDETERTGTGFPPARE